MTTTEMLDRVLLNNPQDTLARLALADALEEQGEDSEAAWQRRMVIAWLQSETFIEAYIATALWSSFDYRNQSHTPEDIHPDTLTAMREDCFLFIQDNGALISHDMARAGHDFWLTRERHGAGFWDGGWNDIDGKYLTKDAHAYGSFPLYVGDDGMIHH